MNRLGRWRPETSIIGLVWVVAIVAWITWAAGWSAAGILATAGVVAVISTWTVWVFIIREREARDRERAEWAVRVARVAQAADLAVPATEVLDNPQLREAAVRELENLRGTHEALRAILDGIGDPVLATDAEGRIAYSNEAANRFFSARGDSPFRPIGLSIDDVFTHADVHTLHADARTGKPGLAQVRWQKPGGARVVQVWATPIEPTGGSSMAIRGGVLLVIRDVTELALALQLKTDFVANASHELRTPLSSIRAAVETLRDGAADDPAMRDKFLNMVGTNAARLEEMVRDLLDLSRLESPEAPLEIGRVHLTEICRGVASMFDEICADRTLTIEPRIDPELDAIETDPKLLQLILKNLVENSTKFAFERTTILITARREGDRRLRLRVVDQGVGIPFEQQARVFERFYQVDPSRTAVGRAVTKSARRGTGLGLAIVKHAVKRLGGSIRVESVWQQGTTMIVDLPMTRPTSAGGVFRVGVLGAAGEDAPGPAPALPE